MTEPIQQNQPAEIRPNSGAHVATAAPSMDIQSPRSASDYVNIERRSQYNTVFLVDDQPVPSIMPRPNHWSVAWSDLMMTMFVLFLSMYVYQMANQEFLAKKKPEILGGDTTEALQSLDSSKATLPFPPIFPGLPLMTGGTIKKVERATGEGSSTDLPFPTASAPLMRSQEDADQIGKKDPTITEDSVQPETRALLLEPGEDVSPQLSVPPVPLPNTDVLGPHPIVPEASPPGPPDKFQEIYRLSKGALEKDNLEKFAAIDIVPDKTMRIILTGDLLFDLGESELSSQAMDSLQKVTAAIRYTPYMINIVGHTDNIPMRSNRFRSNWELSVARASSVARYLIDEVQMDPQQFVVSGYSSYRPLVPNTTAENRARNRRVEIIISRRLPDPLPATAENLR